MQVSHVFLSINIPGIGLRDFLFFFYRISCFLKHIVNFFGLVIHMQSLRFNIYACVLIERILWLLFFLGRVFALNLDCLFSEKTFLFFQSLLLLFLLEHVFAALTHVLDDFLNKSV